MKINWGNGIVISFIVFVGFIGFLVWRSISTDFYLVDENYYKKELAYQEIIDETKEANNLKENVVITKTESSISIKFPTTESKVEGEIHFFRPSDPRKDRKISLALNSHGICEFPISKLHSGYYKVKIRWNSGGNKYYTEKEIFI